MHQSFTIPKLASPVSCLLGRDAYGSHYGAHTEANKDPGFSVDLKAGNSCEKAFSGTVSIGRTGPSVKAEESIRPRAAAEEIGDHIHGIYSKGASTAQGKGGDIIDKYSPSKCAQRLQGHEKTLIASHEKVELIVQLNIDMPIVGTSSSEKQIDALVAESLQGNRSSVTGCNPLKRRSHQDSEEARADKRIKVESNVGLPVNSFNGVDPTVLQRGVEDFQGTNLGDELTKEKDGLRPSVQGNEDSTAAPNSDLTNLLRDLDDSGDSEDLDEDEFGGGPPSWPSLEVALCDEWIGNDNTNEIGVPAHTPLVDPVVKAVDNSSEQEQRVDNIGTKVQAHETIGKASPEIIMLDSDSDDDEDLVMFDQLDETSQLKNTVKLEPGGLRQEPNESSQLENAVKLEPGGLRQMPNEISQLENAVKLDPGGLRQVPNESSQLENAVKVEHGSTRQVPDSMQSPGFQAVTRQNVFTAGQQQPETILQTRVEGGKLMFTVVPKNSARISRMPIFPFPGNLMHPRLAQVYGLPYAYTSGCSTSFAPNNGYAQEATSSGEQAGPDHGLNPPTTSAVVRSSGEQAGPSHGWNPPSTSAGVPSSGEQVWPSHGWIPPSTSAGVPSSGEQVGPSRGWNPPNTSAGVSSSGEQAGPSHGWNPPTTSAVVPYISGASKAEPGQYENANLGPQNVPGHNQLAVVKPSYDSTVSTPRIEVARAMQQYDYYINKAKSDRVRDVLARRASTSNEFVKEGNARGLECRPDIVAYNDMKKFNGDVNRGITVGDLPGVEVGDRFTYRHQMAVVGLHRLPNVGIDYGHPPPDTIPTATAIVLMPKAGYVDDKDNGNTILYTGQGGRKKRNQAAPFVCDQELKKGNLALAKNHERRLPVRVIRGHSVLGNSGPGVLGYTYDGLYIITSYEFSPGMNGYNVYKYSLERLEDQPPIPPCIAGCTAHEWNNARGALGALPLQVMDPSPVEEDVKQLCI